VRPGNVEAEQGRRGVAGAVPAEEPGGGCDLEPAPRGERSADEGGRRRETEQDLGNGTEIAGEVCGGRGPIFDERHRRQPAQALVVAWWGNPWMAAQAWAGPRRGERRSGGCAGLSEGSSHCSSTG
jgi:hypothetical protein